MQKGQISIDLLFTLVAVLLISLTLLSFINSTYITHDKINTKIQLDLENERITNLITQTQMIDETKYTINTTLGKITYLDENKNQIIKYPSVVIEGDLLRLSINNGTETIESVKRFSKNFQTNITFGTGSEQGKIVIIHE